MNPTFGQTVRALRMGFYWSHQHGTFVRLSRTDKENVFRCECHPAGLIPHNLKREFHIRWWPSHHGDSAGLDLDCILTLKYLLMVKRYFVFYFDEEGMAV